MKWIKKWNTLITAMMNSRLAMMILSIIIAIILWFAISISIYPTTPKTFTNIPLTIDVTDTIAETYGLSVIDYDVEKVNVQIEGNRSQIGNLDNDDLIATVSMDEVTTAGTKSLPVTVTAKDGSEFTVKSVSPSRVNVKFDIIETRTFTIEAGIPNLTFADGCIKDENTTVCSPKTLDITGPKAQLDQIARCEAVTDSDETISASTVYNTDTLKFYNEDNAEIKDTSDLSYDISTISMTIGVEYEKTLDITYQITNVPAGFDEKCLDLVQSQQEIKIASPNPLDDMEEFSIGTISLQDLVAGYSHDFNITLPDGYTNLSEFDTVNVSLNSDDLTERTFTINEITVINNSSSTYDYEVTNSQINVTMIGPEDSMDRLEASDLTATVDMFSYSSEANGEGGTTRDIITPTISCSKYDDVWAVEIDRVNVEATPKETTTDDSDSTTTTTETTTETSDNE